MTLVGDSKNIRQILRTIWEGETDTVPWKYIIVIDFYFCFAPTSVCECVPMTNVRHTKKQSPKRLLLGFSPRVFFIPFFCLPLFSIRLTKRITTISMCVHQCIVYVTCVTNNWAVVQLLQTFIIISQKDLELWTLKDNRNVCVLLINACLFSFHIVFKHICITYLTP